MLMKAHLKNNDPLSACVEFLKTNMEVDQKNNYGQLERLKKGISRPDPQIPLEIYGQDINLKLWVNQETGYWMQETPLSQSQTAAATKNQDGFLITAKVPMQEELIWWLRSMGPNIKVLGPQLVVNRIKTDLKKVYGQYKRF
jgi:hypothetical protein